MIKNDELMKILQEEVKPSLGCTGPIGIAYAAAEARDAIGGTPIKIKIYCDKEIASRNEDVGIPGTNEVGLKMAAALGAFAGDANKKLEVLKDVTQNDQDQAYAFSLTEQCIIEPDWDTEAVGLYVEAHVETNNGLGRAIVAKAHNNLVFKEANGKVLYDAHFERKTIIDEINDPIAYYDLKDLYTFVMEAPIESFNIMREAIDMNIELANVALDGRVGIGIGSKLLESSKRDIVRKAKAIAAAGSEARMAGYDLPAMSCATSGNAGIACSLPLYSIANDIGAEEELLLRATALSYMVTILTRHRIGRHSTMCACVVAASQGVAAGTTLLLGGAFNEVNMAINNTIVNIFGVICDGPRITCALKLSTAIGIAIEGALLAMDGLTVPLNTGIVGKDANDSINFMGNFAKTAMVQTSKELAKMLYNKHQK